MTKSPSLGILVTEPAVTDQPPPPPPAPPTLASLQLLAESLSPTLGSPVSFQVLALGMDGLSLPSTAFSVEVDGVQQTTSQTGPDGTSHFSLTFSQYGNYAVVVKSGSFASNTVSLSIPQPPPPPPAQPQAPSPGITVTAAGISITVNPQIIGTGSEITATISGVPSQPPNLGAAPPSDGPPLVMLAVFRPDLNLSPIGSFSGTSGTVTGVFSGGESGGYRQYGLVLMIQWPYQYEDPIKNRLRTEYYGNYYLYGPYVATGNLSASATGSPGSGTVYAGDTFFIDLAKPTLVLTDGGQIGAQLNVTTHRIFISAKSVAGPVAGIKVGILNQNLSGLGFATTDENGSAFLDITFQQGSSQNLTAYWPNYPPTTRLGLTSEPLLVQF